MVNVKLSSLEQGLTTSRITWRLQGQMVKVTRSQRILLKSAITQYWIVPTTSYFGDSMWTTPQPAEMCITQYRVIVSPSHLDGNVRPSTSIEIQTVCNGNTGCLPMGQKIMGFMTPQTPESWYTCSPWGSGHVTQITLADTPTRCTALAVMSLTIFNAVIMPVVNVLILY